MRLRDRELAGRLEEGLISFSRKHYPLPGIVDEARRKSLVEQMVESIRRVNFVQVIGSREISERRIDPDDNLFDPLRAAIIQMRRGSLDEAFWLVFLFVHFGKHPRAGWRYAREVYGRVGEVGYWDWQSVSQDPEAFRTWLREQQWYLRRPEAPGGFGNHRKYQSLDANTPTGTGAAVISYVNWVNPPRSHSELMQEALDTVGGDPRIAFHNLYRSMNAVASFGRTARFDYLSMVGKLGLAPVEPDSAYLQGATGPLKGARALFGSEESAEVLDRKVVELGDFLEVGMQVLEDSLCNWQKSPTKFVPFRG